MKRCAKCKERVVDNSNFCPNCGVSFKKAPKPGLILRPFNFIWRKKLPIAVALIFIMSSVSLGLVASGYARQRDIIKGEVSEFFNENKDQFKGEKGDMGSMGLPGRDGADGFGGSLNCYSHDFGFSSSTTCY